MYDSKRTFTFFGQASKNDYKTRLERLTFKGETGNTKLTVEQGPSSSLVRTPPSHGGGPGFKSPRAHQFGTLAPFQSALLQRFPKTLLCAQTKPVLPRHCLPNF